ncbi:hypothetical protein GR925_25760 [Streptomyces sp. HUCO-GS316]|uniref:hypothetical protein n=1 Tax=Streptomyces sp. HUCO-GS316 TaxID=2692198 RepID=UPI001368B080|nr:hypothetical protein [Streptomyces sp. HUCO-GS316]MXM66743.1 hypothetical protein [Streptomyces sp. HUCO-GS316]
MSPATVEELRRAFRAHARPLKGGHRRWRGSLTTGDIPILFVRKERHTAARVAFLLQQGREPVGNVKSSCGLLWCVAPAHQADRVMRDAVRAAAREEERAAAALVDELAVELALAGRLADPRLSPAEKRAAVALAPPAMPVITLARRLGCCTRTVKTLRAELAGATS